MEKLYVFLSILLRLHHPIIKPPNVLCAFIIIIDALADY